jgi:hypothetical protein
MSRPPARIAVLIGNGTFPQSQSALQPLAAPAHDVAVLGGLLADPEICRFEDPVKLVDRDAMTIKKTLLRTLDAAAPDDLVLVYYAGHGKLDGAQLYLCTHDTEPETLAATSVPVRDVHHYISRSACRQVVLVLDCCFAGAAADVFHTRGELSDRVEAAASARGVFLLTSCGAYEPSLERGGTETGELPYGVYTRALVDGILSGQADLYRDGRITPLELARYLQQRIPGQTPRVSLIDGEGDEPVLAWTNWSQNDGERKRVRTRLAQWYAEETVPDGVFYQAVSLLSRVPQDEVEKQRKQLLGLCTGAEWDKIFPRAWAALEAEPRDAVAELERFLTRHVADGTLSQDVYIEAMRLLGSEPVDDFERKRKRLLERFARSPQRDVTVLVEAWAALERSRPEPSPPPAAAPPVSVAAPEPAPSVASAQAAAPSVAAPVPLAGPSLPEEPGPTAAPAPPPSRPASRPASTASTPFVAKPSPSPAAGAGSVPASGRLNRNRTEVGWRRPQGAHLAALAIVVMMTIVIASINNFRSRDGDWADESVADPVSYASDTVQGEAAVETMESTLALVHPVSRELYDVPYEEWVQSIRFFQGEDTIPAPQDRVYGYRFQSESTKFVYYEITVSTQVDSVIQIPDRWEAIWYRPDGSMLAHDTLKTHPYTGMAAGRGWSMAGSWAPGLYRLELVHRGRRIAMAGFEILAPGVGVEIPGLSGRVSEVRFYDDVDTTRAWQRDDRHRFDSRYVQRLSSWLRLTYPTPVRQETPLGVRVEYRASDGRLVGSAEVRTTARPGSMTTDVSLSAARTQSWSPGAYRADFYVNRERVAKGFFDFYDPTQ